MVSWCFPVPHLLGPTPGTLLAPHSSLCHFCRSLSPLSLTFVIAIIVLCLFEDDQLNGMAHLLFLCSKVVVVHSEVILVAVLLSTPFLIILHYE